jgi:UDP-glucose 4-epimerase
VTQLPAMRVLVTGARGFLGSTVGAVARQRGYAVHGIGRSAQPPEGWSSAYSWFDVASADLRPIVDKFEPDLIFHGAGSSSVEHSFKAPLEDFRASAVTLCNLLDAVRRSSRRPVVIFPSSAAVYGQPESLPVAESYRCQPISPYGVNKWQAETVAASYAKYFGLTVVNCRLFSLFGPTQKRLLVWELFRKVMGEGAEIELKGTGRETRDFLYADDAANLMLDLAASQRSEPAGCSTFNVASGTECSVLEMVEIIQKLCGRSKPVRPAEATPTGDPERWHADMAQVKQLLPEWSAPQLGDRLRMTLKQWSS